MPLYEYQCGECGRRTEKRQKFSDAALTECSFCAGPLKKLISAPAIQFKGGGWFADGYGNAKSGASATASGEGGGSSAVASDAGAGSSKSEASSGSSDAASSNAGSGGSSSASSTGTASSSSGATTTPAASSTNK